MKGSPYSSIISTSILITSAKTLFPNKVTFTGTAIRVSAYLLRGHSSTHSSDLGKSFNPQNVFSFFCQTETCPSPPSPRAVWKIKCNVGGNLSVKHLSTLQLFSILLSPWKGCDKVRDDDCRACAFLWSYHKNKSL